MANGDNQTATMTPKQVFADPTFWGLEQGEQQKVLQKIDKNYAALPADQQLKVLEGASKESWEPGFAGISVNQPPDPDAPDMSTGIPQWMPKEGESVADVGARANRWRQKHPEEFSKGLSEEQQQNVKQGVPLLAGTALSMGLGPEAGMFAKAATFGTGAAAGRAVEDIYHDVTRPPGELPTSREEAEELGKTFGVYGLADLGFNALFKGMNEAGRGLMRRLDPYEWGTENFLRAVSPSDPDFMDNIDVAANDIANIYERSQGDIREARGGFMNADKRYNATLKAFRSYMDEMYQNERAGQIAAAQQYGVRVTVPGNSNEIQYIGKWLSKQLPIDSPQLAAAQKLANNPLAPLSIDEADALAKAVNSMDLKTAWEQSSSRTLSGKRALDQGLKDGINSQLRAIGQPGIESYERRYAALSRIYESMEKQTSRARMQRMDNRVRAFLSLHGPYVRTPLHEGFSAPGGLLEDSMEAINKAQQKGHIPPSPTSRANPQTIYQGQPVPPTTPPAAQGTVRMPPTIPTQPGGAGGAAAPAPRGGMTTPPRIAITPEQFRPTRALPETSSASRTYEGPERRGKPRVTAQDQAIWDEAVRSSQGGKTPGEKLSEDIRKQRAGTPHSLSEGDVRREIMKDPQQYEKFRKLDAAANRGDRSAQKARDQMLVDFKNKIIEGSKRGAMPPPPKVQEEDFDF